MCINLLLLIYMYMYIYVRCIIFYLHFAEPDPLPSTFQRTLYKYDDDIYIRYLFAYILVVVYLYIYGFVGGDCQQLSNVRFILIKKLYVYNMHNNDKKTVRVILLSGSVEIFFFFLNCMVVF